MTPNETLLSHDRLALFGYGVFETLLITEQGPLFIDLHWQRLHRGAKLLGLKLPALDKWLDQILEFIGHNPGDFPYALRVTLSGGAPLTDLPSKLLFYKRLVPYTPTQYARGMRLHVLSTFRNEHSLLVSIKSTNYLENILAKEEAKLQGADEGLWLNTKGYLAEGTMSNLFFIKDETLFTPSLSSGCLPGTRRQLILDLAHSLQMPALEGSYSLSDLLSADEIFMTNALMGIMPVNQVADTHFPVSENSALRNLESAYKDLIKNASSPSKDFQP